MTGEIHSDRDVYIRGHVTYVGQTSLEVTLNVEQVPSLLSHFFFAEVPWFAVLVVHRDVQREPWDELQARQELGSRRDTRRRVDLADRAVDRRAPLSLVCSAVASNAIGS